MKRLAGASSQNRFAWRRGLSPNKQAKDQGRVKGGKEVAKGHSGYSLPVTAWHQDDHCIISPPAGSAALFSLIPSAGKASSTFVGGHSVATDPCGAFSEHGHAGIEEKVVKAIAQFIRGDDAD